jgi:hypothetical protein
MVWFALSFQEQVEKYGVYVGIASFFGLALLSVLYFSQARELKRLREWAGRAPERARELEQRVVAQATATVARRAPQPPAAPGKPAGAIAPARRLAEMPAPAPGQATELVDELPGEEAPATNGNVPAPPSEDADAATATANGDSKGAEETGAQPEEAPAVPAEGEAEQPEPQPAAVSAAAVTGQETEEHSALDETGEHEPEPEHEPEHEPDETGEHDPGPETDDVPAVAVPRRTPAQRVGVTPKPQPLPLRQSNPTATPAGRRPPGPAPGRRPAPAAPKEPGKRSAGTIVLLAGLAVLLLGGTAFGLSQVLGGDDPTPPPNQSQPPSGQNAGTNGSVPNEETTVAVLNGTTTNGLAGTIADRLQAEAGYAKGTTATNTRDQTLQASTVYYGEGFRGQARAVGRLLGVDTIEPVDEETQALAPDADVIVLAGADKATSQ